MFHGIKSEWDYRYDYFPYWYRTESVKGWERSIIDNIPKSRNKCIFLRNINTYNIAGYSSIVLRIKYYSGIVVYIENDEILRKNLPSGNININTFANNYNPEGIRTDIIMPLELFKENTVIGIELHRYKSETNFPQLSILTFNIVGFDGNPGLEMNIYAKPITKYSEEFQTKEIWPVRQGFDRDLTSPWEQTWPYPKSDNICSWVELDFGNTYISINELSLTLMSKGSGEAPKDTSITYYRDDIIFFESNHKNMSNSDKTNYYSFLIPLYSMNKLRFAIYSTHIYNENYTNMGFRDFGIHVKNINYCDSFSNVKRANFGDTVTVKCINTGYSGNKTFYCQRGIFPTWVEINNDCQDEPILIETYEKYYKFVQGEYMKDLKLFSVSGHELTYSLLGGILEYY